MTVVARLSAPLLAWPAPSRYRDRLTKALPTFSALHGVIAAAAGVGRGALRPKWLDQLVLAARADRPGSVVCDFHTVSPVPERLYWTLSPTDAASAARRLVTAENASRSDPLITRRYYRQDSTYVVAIDDPSGNIAEVLTSPHFTLYGGRKSCPFAFPVLLDAEYSGDVEDVMSSFPTASAHAPGPAMAVSSDGEPGGGASSGGPSASARGTAGTCTRAVLEAVLFQEPARLRPIRVEEAFELPSGPVGEAYRSKTRWVVHVTPDVAGSWTELVRSPGHRERTYDVA